MDLYELHCYVNVDACYLVRNVQVNYYFCVKLLQVLHRIQDFYKTKIQVSCLRTMHVLCKVLARLQESSTNTYISLGHTLQGVIQDLLPYVLLRCIYVHKFGCFLCMFHNMTVTWLKMRLLYYVMREHILCHP